MRTWDTKWMWALMITAGVAVTALGCGDDDEGGGDDAGMAGRGSSGRGGAGSGGRSGSGGGGTGGTSGRGGTGGTPAAMCDTTVMSQTSCGGTMCPTLSPFAGMMCTVSCCTASNQCGTRMAPAGGTPTMCTPSATPDPNCPGYMGMVMGMAINLPGCCHSSGRCGAISSLSSQCIVSSMILMDLMPGAPCGGGEDAGTENDGG